MGLDFGAKTIGVAIGCADSRVATGLTTITRDHEEALKPSIHKLKEIIREYGVTHIVLGFPIHMDGSLSPRAKLTQDFADKLKRNFKSKEITLWDERLSTQAVTRAFYAHSTKSTKKQQKTYHANVDEMAAVYILQGYLSKLEENMENDTNMPMENEDMGEIIIVNDDEGNEYQLHVLASKEGENCVYMLAAIAEDDDETSEVVHLKCVLGESDEDAEDEEMDLEMVDEEHEDFQLVMELFKADYEELGIIMDEEDSQLGG